MSTDNRSGSNPTRALGPRNTLLPRLGVVVFALSYATTLAQEKPASTEHEKVAPATQAATQEDKQDTDTDELSQKLLRQAVTESDEDVMAQILRLMHETARQLALEFNPGPRTLALQEQIMERLDQAIEAAAAQRRPSAGGQQQSRGDKRRMPGQKQPGEGGDEKQDADASDRDSAGTGVTEAGTTTRTDRAGGELTESRRTWGNLPLREREEVIQGSGEGFLERYRNWIERYYRALQEVDE